jgi:ketosteroid isomerase-like protein
MSDANKEILLQANAAVVRGDHEGFLAHCTDDVVWEFVGDQTLRGKAAVRAYMRTNYTEPPTFTVKHLIADDSFVTAIGEIDSKDPHGQVVRSAYCDVWRVRDGMLAELRAFVIPVNPTT